MIQGITGNAMKVKGKIELRINDTLESLTHECYVVESLPKDLDLILGQTWLRLKDYQLGPVIEPLSEKIVQFKTSEKGTRLIDHQEFQKGVVCASSLVFCENNAYSCMVLNKSSNPIRITGAPTLQKPPSRQVGNVCTEVKPRQERVRLLNQKLRLDHVTEGSEEIRKLCEEFVDIFKLPGDKLSSTTAAEHVIPTPEIPKGRAITLKNYRLPEAHQEEISKQVEQMLEDGVITESKSEWNFPLIVVPKKMDASGERKWRLCIDFRKLNEVTIGDSYPLPNIQDILDKLGRGRYFTALDCASGYLQVPIAKEDQCKTAFSTPMGHYEYKRMPFGLKSAPSTFQRMMNNILGELLGTKALVYIDDILVTGESLAEHNQKLRQIFSKMREYNLKIEPDKCDFLKQELTYLGHVVTPDGVKPDPKKTEAILKFPIPKNPKDVKSFLGLAGYYRKFISDFSAIARPLTNLLKKEISWTWDEREQNSFEMLQAKLSSAPLLQYPDFTKPFIITTDASGYAIGAILSQGKLGQDKPISYASRTLNQAELHYTTTEKELLAVVWACKHFRPYVFGRKFQIVTDHKGLIWIFNVKDPSSRLIRWKLLLEEYDYEIVHRAGKRHCNADSLSRNPISCMITTEEITKERRQSIINEFHNCPIGGHQGITRTLERIKLYIQWEGMESDVKEFIQHCAVCQKQKQQGRKHQNQLTITDTMDNPWEKLYLDVVGPLPLTEDGHKYILTCQDNLSKYLIAAPMESQTAEEVSDKFIEHVILIYGIPNQILTDQGTNFMSEIFKRVCKLLKIEKMNTTAYHPESNGAIERTHKTLINYLRCFCHEKNDQWHKWVKFATFAYNTTPHSITKFTPYEMLFGRIANIPGVLQKSGRPQYNYDDFVMDLKSRLQNTFRTAKDRLRSQKLKQQKRGPQDNAYYDKGDLVLLQVENKHKLDALWKGPFEVIEDRDPNVVIQEVGKRKPHEVHKNRLKPYFSPVSD